MHTILILSETDVPGHLAGSGRWPGLRIEVEANLTHDDLSQRLRATPEPGAVIVNTSTSSAELTSALTRLACPSVEVLAHNPNRHPDGSANLAAEPVGADAIVYGLGTLCYETAVSLLAAQLERAAK